MTHEPMADDPCDEQPDGAPTWFGDFWWFLTPDERAEQQAKHDAVVEKFRALPWTIGKTLTIRKPHPFTVTT